ncbi:hypothetical protein [Algoriphagus sp. CAU 1675]|uniref:hypothetical protein n=1 Tax=Algoriphagus sp. CAU 1675 TaxID=3032597 RepID=UPI0023DCD7BA|nr:hypothetical protein [Algoriphagus sp. CAU 1675]MDF2157349.1 hypothetical protein [Algoriphagus sp. CAU 1675]
MRSLILVFTLSLFALQSFAQHWNESAQSDSDEKLFGRDLKAGSFEFHLRSYFMSTLNEGELTDYSTWGTGAGLGYFSPRWKGFGVGFSGFFVFRHFENNITIEDPITGRGNRYEITLFDVHHPENHKDMDRLEEFYISYLNDKVSVWAGRHHFESPLLNAADNRLRPNLFSGVSGDYKFGDWKVTGAWFTHLISRGSLEWLPVEESLGFYSTGRNPYGVDESYHHHVRSKGIGSLGLEYEQEDLKFKAWNYLAEGMFDITFLESTGRNELKPGLDLVWGAQGFYETAVGDGGNPDPSLTYIMPGENTFGGGLKAGLNWGHSELSINYLGISHNGRFLFPREWGREQFFVSLQRERFDGLGGVNTLMLRYDQTFIHDQLMFSFGASHSQTPDLNNLLLNKYGVPNYFHFSGLVDYRFKGYFEGLDLQFLAVYKHENLDAHLPLEYVINRVNMANLSLILDYRF